MSIKENDKVVVKVVGYEGQIGEVVRFVEQSGGFDIALVRVDEDVLLKCYVHELETIPPEPGLTDSITITREEFRKIAIETINNSPTISGLLAMISAELEVALFGGVKENE